MPPRRRRWLGRRGCERRRTGAAPRPRRRAALARGAGRAPGRRCDPRRGRHATSRGRRSPSSSRRPCSAGELCSFWTGRPGSPQRLRELLAPGLDGVLAALAGEPLADLVAGPRRGDDLQPVARRAGGGDLRGDDLDGVARVQLGVEREQPAVDPGADAAVTDLGVDRVGEVDRRRAGRQGDDLALRREDVDLVLLEVDLERLEELDGIGRLALPVDDPLQPGDLVGRTARPRLGRRACAASLPSL